MKNRLLILFLSMGWAIVAHGQYQTRVLNLKANDLVYDATHDRIYASLPSANGAIGNSMGIITPNDAMLERTVFIGSEPTVLALSDNDQYVYAGFSGSSSIRRFVTATQTADIQFSLGTDLFTGPYYAEDIAVLPGQPASIAVSRRNLDFSPRHEGVAIYDNNQARPETTPGHTGSNKIEFITPTMLIGQNVETTEFGLRTLSVSAAGVTETAVTNSIVSTFELDFIYHNNRVYYTNGDVVDVGGEPFIAGRFTDVIGPVVYDAQANLLCFVHLGGSGVTLKRFNPDNFLLEDGFDVPESLGHPLSLTTCGAGCYAFSTWDDKVVILQDPLLTTPTADAAATLQVFPNPTADYLHVAGAVDLAYLQLMDVNGRVVLSETSAEGRLDLSGHPAGVYLLRAVRKTGVVTQLRIVKK